MIHIGIDPGQNGGIAYISEHGAIVEKMPDTESEVADLLRLIKHQNKKVFALIEHVHSMPKQGVASSFKFGKSYGFLRACLICLDIPFEEVTPQKWQKIFIYNSKGDSKTKHKNKLKAKAQQLFPKHNITLATADAILIAEYCRRKRSGELIYHN